MLLGVRKRFLFIATPACAEVCAAIEDRLRPGAEIERTGPTGRVHISARRAMKLYRFAMKRTGKKAHAPSDFFRFAVLRDPVDLLYARFRAAKADLPEGTDFARWWADLVPRLEGTAGDALRQAPRLTGKKGRLLVDHLIPYADAQAHLTRIAAGLGLSPGALLPKPQPGAPAELDPALRAEIDAVFAEDRALCDRIRDRVAFDHPALSGAARPIARRGSKRPQVVVTGPEDASLPGNPDYFFLFMPNNSGSTVMAQYLASQSAVYLPPFGNNEGQHIPQARPLMTYSPWSAETPRDWERIRAIWEVYREGRTFLESSPPNLVRVNEIAAAFGDRARFFFSICDPYQQIASTLYNYTTPPLAIGAQAVAQWVLKAGAVRDGRARFPEAPFLSYEDFCEDPGRMNAALGLGLVRPIRIPGKQNTKISEIRNTGGRTCAFLTAAEIDDLTEVLRPHEALVRHFGYRLRSGAELLAEIGRAEDRVAGEARRAAWIENGGKIKLRDLDRVVPVSGR